MMKIIDKIINTIKEDENGNGIVVHLMEEEEENPEGIKNKVLRITRFDNWHFKEEVFIVIDDL